VSRTVVLVGSLVVSLRVGAVLVILRVVPGGLLYGPVLPVADRVTDRTGLDAAADAARSPGAANAADDASEL